MKCPRVYQLWLQDTVAHTHTHCAGSKFLSRSTSLGRDSKVGSDYSCAYATLYPIQPVRLLDTHSPLWEPPTLGSAPMDTNFGIKFSKATKMCPDNGASLRSHSAIVEDHCLYPPLTLRRFFACPTRLSHELDECGLNLSPKKSDAEYLVHPAGKRKIQITLTNSLNVLVSVIMGSIVMNQYWTRQES